VVSKPISRKERGARREERCGDAFPSRTGPSGHDMHARSNFFSAASALFARDGILRALCAGQPYAQSLVTC